MKDRLALILVISLGSAILLLLWFTSLRFTSANEDKFRTAIGEDLAEASATYDALKLQIAATKKHYDFYQTAIKRGTTEERDLMRSGWIVNSQRECELEVLLREQVNAIERKIKERSGRIVLPSRLHEHHAWQTFQRHLGESEFYEPIGGCEVHYRKLR